VFAHHRTEVTDTQILQILALTQDTKPSEIIPNELYIGGFKSVTSLASDTTDPSKTVINCAGKSLNQFFPNTLKPFDKLRDGNRLIDLEWEDSPTFAINLEELLTTLNKARQLVQSGNSLLINCAQGKSRSGTFAAAYIMLKYNMGADDAIEFVREKRPFVNPNVGFREFLRENEERLKTASIERKSFD
jgi:hypothetical protein